MCNIFLFGLKINAVGVGLVCKSSVLSVSVLWLYIQLNFVAFSQNGVFYKA